MCALVLSSLALGWYYRYSPAQLQLQPTYMLQVQVNTMENAPLVQVRNETFIDRVTYSILTHKREEKRLNGLEKIIVDATNGKYDYVPILTPENVSAMNDPVYKITNEILYERINYVYDASGKATEGKVAHRMILFGSGVVIKKAEKEQKLLVLTASHVLNQPKLPVDTHDDKGRIVLTSKLITQNIVFVTADTELPLVNVGLPMKVLVASNSADITLAEVEVPDKKEFARFKTSPKIGNSDELMTGHIIYLIGFPHNVGKMLSNGIVLSPGNPDRSWDDTNFYTNATSNPGNSGGPAYAIRDGQPELVGILSWRITNSEGLHGSTRINYVKPLLTDENLPLYFRDRTGSVTESE